MDKLDKLFVANEVRKAKLYAAVRPVLKKKRSVQYYENKNKVI